MLACKSTHMLAKSQKVDSLQDLSAEQTIHIVFKVNAVKQIHPAKNYDFLLSQHDLTPALKSLPRWCEGTDISTSWVQQLQSWQSWGAATNALTGQAKREPTQKVKRRERLHIWCEKKQVMLRFCYVVKWAPVTSFKTALEHKHAVYQLVRGWPNFDTIVIFGAFCKCRDFFFWGESSGCWKQETLLPHQNACSVYWSRTASMVACKSTHKTAESQKVDSVLETLRCTNKTHHFPTKALVQCTDHAEPKCSRVKAHTFWLEAKK